MKKSRRKRAEEAALRFLPIMDVQRENYAQIATRLTFRNYYAAGWINGYRAALRLIERKNGRTR